jgi:DNA repair protein RecO (recombination protein O)
MLATTEGVILHVLKYGESSVIATIYTKHFGRQAYIINSPRTGKTTKRPGLQSMFLVNIVAYYKDSREIHRVKEIKNYPAYQNIPFDILKSTQALFISEILYKILHEQESSPDLYSFIKNSFLFFDLAEVTVSNFHIYFLLRLTEYLGFMPDMRMSGKNSCLDLHQGIIVPYEPAHDFFVNAEATQLICILSNLKISDLGGLKISKNMRSYLINKLVEYYWLHFENMGEIKSLKVLREVFS